MEVPGTLANDVGKRFFQGIVAYVFSGRLTRQGDLIADSRLSV